MRRCVLSVVVLIASLGAAPRDAHLAPFSLRAARDIVGVWAPNISPDGKRVVYVRSRVDYQADTYRTELVLVDVAGGASHVLTQDREGVASPQWSPDGERIAYLALPQKGKPAQIYVLPLSGGDSRRVTDAKNGVNAFAWKPDGSEFAFASDDDAPNAEAAKKHDDAFEVNDEHFLTRAPSVPTRLWRIASAGTGAKRITSGATSVSKQGANLCWSPDGRYVYYERQPNAVFANATDATAIRHDVSEGVERELVANAAVGSLALSLDGRNVAYAKPRHGSAYLQNDTFVADASEGATVAAPFANTLSIDRNVHWFAFAGRHAALAVGTADGVRNVLWSLPLNGGSATKIDLGDVDFAPDATVAADGTIAFVGQRRGAPPEIYALAPGGSPTRLSDDNPALSRYAIGMSQRIDWTTDDGLAACGVLTYPPDAEPNKKYPLVMIIHGGPVSTSTWNFSVLPQVLAAHGYLVFQPNYRGSDDLGDAYLQAIVGHVTSGPGRDNLAGLAAVEKLGIVDESRIGVSGWSGGGLQTSWLVGHAHIWKAAVSGAAVNDWYEQAVLADVNEAFARVFMDGATPWTKQGRAAFAAESPITYAKAITTPVLILSDTGDQRVPITQSYALYHALKAMRTPVRFVAFPRMGHFPSDPVGREAVYRTWSDWFVRWLR